MVAVTQPVEYRIVISEEMGANPISHPHGLVVQLVRAPACHAGNTGSSPVQSANLVTSRGLSRFPHLKTAIFLQASNSIGRVSVSKTASGGSIPSWPVKRTKGEKWRCHRVENPAMSSNT